MLPWMRRPRQVRYLKAAVVADTPSNCRMFSVSGNHASLNPWQPSLPWPQRATCTSENQREGEPIHPRPFGLNPIRTSVTVDEP